MTAIAVPRLGARWLAEYARRPLNVVLLIIVPVVFVTLSAGALADFADMLGGAAALGEVEAATAGWAAAVLAGVAAFFHVSQSREPDRRLAAAGVGACRVVASRMMSTLVLAVTASAGALTALGVRTDLATSARVVGASVLSAVIYTGLGVLVGAFVQSEMNGSLIVVFVWIFDVFFGPAMGGTATFLRLFPLHFPTLVVTGVASGHGGALGELGTSLLWAGASLALAGLALTTTTAHRPNAVRTTSPRLRRLAAALRSATRQLRRMPVLWLLIVGLPVAFISASIAVTPDDPTPVELVEQGRRTLTIESMADVHGAVMVPITIGFLASLAGLFVILDSAQADRRLALTDYRPGEILIGRMASIVVATLIASAVGLAVTAVSFDAVNWWLFALANGIVGLTYATIGVIVGPVFGRLGGLYLLLLLPFIDIGLAQNAMFDAAPPAWGRYLPAHGAMRVLMDAAFTPGFDETGALLAATIWLVALGGSAVVVFRKVMIR
ncbi:MAG: ABC transporter permease [Acidimicrobiales bacterium]